MISEFDPWYHAVRPLTLQLGTTEVLQNLLPVRRVVVAAQVWLELATQNLQRRTFANTVRSHETKNLTGTGHGQTVELEAVGRVAVGDLSLQVGGQVDDVNGTERALLGTDTATNAQPLGDEGDFGLGCHFNAKLTRTNDGARLLALLTTFLRFALYFEEYWCKPAMNEALEAAKTRVAG